VTATLRNGFEILTYGAQRLAETLGIKWQPDRSRGYYPKFPGKPGAPLLA